MIDVKEISLDTARRLFREELRKALQDQEEPNIRLAYQCFTPVRLAVNLIQYVKDREKFSSTWKDDSFMLELNNRLAQLELDYLLSKKFWSN